MYRLFVVIITLSITMNIFPQNRSTDREPVAAGSFYPANKDILKNDLMQLFRSCEKPKETWKVRAIISPHAGYVFSGKTAASAYSSIPPNSVYKNIFLIGSSHIMAFNGASVYNTGDYITPLGRVTVNREIANKLKQENDVFKFPVTAHLQEHSLEVQMPFIQYYFQDPPPVVPIIIGTNNIKTIHEIAEALRPWFNDDNLFIISSDFSHYPSYNDARVVDKLTADAIISGDPDNFLNALRKNASKSINGLATSMCGWTSGLTLLYLDENNPDLQFKEIDYTNSGDSRYGSKDEVVGYNAIALVEKKTEGSAVGNSKDQVSFTDAEIDQLFSIARSSIRSMLYENKKLAIDPATLSPKVKEKMGAFVTLKINNNLRGCIGRFTSDEPLYEVVSQMAVASAFSDTRFNPLTKEEYPKTEIEISVLGPLKKIKNPSEIVLGKHGIYIKKDFRSGTMLPQVATENNWTVDEFLGYTSRDKAGLGWLGWQNADIYIYEAVVLEERKK
jgi:AmmeMemoRadiSam system protein B/AmmeMemoRadiSam system protein A